MTVQPSSPEPSNRSRWPLLFLGGALLVVFHRLLVGEVFFWGLPALQFVPWREYAFELIRAGQLPVWNPFNGAGAPLFANYQSALLYPLNWAGLVLPLAWSMSVLAALHLFLAGWGMWRFTGRIGVTALGRGVSALAFGMTGYLVARVGTYPMIDAAAWLPWLLWAAHGVIVSGRARDGGWLALFNGLMLLAGHAQTSWYSLLLVALYAGWLAARPHPLSPSAPFQDASQNWERGGRWRRFAAVGLCLILGAGLAAAQLLATAELLASSSRSAGVDYDFAMNFSFDPGRALNLFSPQIFGTPADGSYAVGGFYFEYAVYVGLIPLLSAFAAVVGWLTRRRALHRPAFFAQVPFWLVIILVAFVLALGRHTPVFPFLYRSVPTFALFQAPARWLLWVVFGLSVLAGAGISAWGRGYRAKRWARRGIVAFGAMAVAALALVLARGSGSVNVLSRAFMGAGLLGVIACWLTLRQPERGARGYGRWSALVLLAVAADLAWASWGLNPTVPASFFNPRPPGDGFARAYWPDDAEDVVKFEFLFRARDYRTATERWRDARGSNLPNLNLLDRRSLLDNFDPLLFGPYAEYVRRIENASEDARGHLLQAAGVSSVYARTGAARPLGLPAARAWIAPSACWHESAASLEEALLDSSWNPQAQVHMLGDGGCPEPPPAGVENAALLVDDEADQLEIDVQSRADGWLVLADVDYPGWSATVDGVPVPIYRANGAFRAIQVPPGQHRVTFYYRPWWLLPGALAAVISGAILLVLFGLQDQRSEG